MAQNVRRIDSAQVTVLVAQHNAQRLDMAKLKAGTIFHVDTTAADASPTAVDLPSVIVMANALKAELNTHMASAASATSGQGAHLTADATNPVTAAAAVDLTTSETLLNAIKTAFNAHLTQANVHHTNDGTNTVATVAATDLPSSITLANALQGKINAHFAAGFTHQAIQIVQA